MKPTTLLLTLLSLTSTLVSSTPLHHPNTLTLREFIQDPGHTCIDVDDDDIGCNVDLGGGGGDTPPGPGGRCSVASCTALVCFAQLSSLLALRPYPRIWE